MAEPVVLHSRVLHVAARVVPGAFLAFMGVAVFGVVRESGDWRYVAAAAIPLAMAWLLRNTLWRTRAVAALDGRLLIGRRDRQLVVPLSDVVEVTRPFWAFNPVFAPSELVLRDGTRVPFFAALGTMRWLGERLKVGAGAGPVR